MQFPHWPQTSQRKTEGQATAPNDSDGLKDRRRADSLEIPPNRKIDDGHHNFSVCRVSGRTHQFVLRRWSGHQRLAAVVRIPSWGPSRTPGTGNRAVNHSGDAPDVDFRNESLTSVVSAVPGCAEARKTSFAGRAEAPVSAWCRWFAVKCTREVLLPGVAPEPPDPRRRRHRDGPVPLRQASGERPSPHATPQCSP